MAVVSGFGVDEESDCGTGCCGSVRVVVDSFADSFKLSAGDCWVDGLERGGEEVDVSSSSLSQETSSEGLVSADAVGSETY